MQRLLTIAEAMALQKALNLHGAKLAVDGHFGELSRLAVIRFQHSAGIIPESGNPDDATLAALGIPNLFAPPPAPRFSPLGSPIIRLGVGIVLNQLTKGLIPMNFLTGYKTFIIGGLLIVLGGIELLGWQLPGIPLDPSQGIPTIMTGIGLITGRVGSKTEAAKVAGK
jgi:peptidoglycan hydrolase-like protein with peptidoglycan-binding domain